ncbi:hypothetical protein [Chimaeribacter californicus]|uniref:hypothetical protein n=1 Tax=Chimaeribacter californicus TaxID=2060067 RepID=UPI0013FD05CA|nr:hypothetical protein [Chimaeribacter californicus]
MSTLTMIVTIFASCLVGWATAEYRLKGWPAAKPRIITLVGAAMLCELALIKYLFLS